MAFCVVTGAAGFVGSHLAQALLRERHQVLGIDSFTTAYDRSVKMRNVDLLRDTANFKSVEKSVENLTNEDVDFDGAFVFHLAGQPGVRDSWGAGFGECVRNNIVATQALLELFRVRRPRRLILASSSSVYGAGTGRPMREDDHTAPLSPYGVTKVAAEKLCLAYAHEQSIPMTILRFFSVFGPRQRPDMLLHKLIAAALDRQPLTIFGSTGQERDFTYVDDIVRGCLATISRSTEIDVFNLASGVSVSLDRCIQAVEERAGCAVPLIMAERKAGDPAQTLGDITRAQSILNYHPATRFEDGLARQWEWMSKAHAAAR